MQGKKPRRTRMTPARAIITVLTLILASAAAVLAYSVFFAPKPVYIDYNGVSIEAFRDVPVNAYAAEAFYSDGTFTRYRSPGAKCGIDVSVYQGEIDWRAVADAGVDFAMIRAGYRGYGDGEIYPDPNFVSNIEGALDAGLDVGVYFFSQAVSAEEAQDEAAFTLSAAAPYDVTYPVVFDWETITEDEARTDGFYALATECAAAFCEKVKAAGYSPAVYFNVPTGYLVYDLSELSGYSFWLAEYDPYPGFYYNFDIWQYSNTGAVPGIDAAVDLNVSFRDFGNAAPE